MTSSSWNIPTQTLNDIVSGSINGQSTYNLTFSWANFTQGSAGPHSDTIQLVTNDAINGQRTQTVTFKVVGTDSPAYVAKTSRPTTVST